MSELLRERALGPDAVVRAGEDVLRALAHAHGRGVVHRDVKPGNILVGRDGRARLSDFGIARLSGEAGLTLTGGVLGTVAYMAPEQARGEGAGTASDVYSAALVVYEGLAGSNPIAGSSPAETARRAGVGGAPPLEKARPDLPRDLCRAVDAGLRREPVARPAAADLADALGDGLGGAAARRRRGRRMLPALASAGAGAGLAAAALARGGAVVRDAVGVDPHGPAIVAAALLAAALLAARAPRATALLAVAAGTALVAHESPGAAVVLGALALALVLSGWRAGRLVLLAMAGPAFWAAGLGPLLPALAGLARRWPARLWTAAAGAVAALAWQSAAGAGGLLAGGGYVPSALADLHDERSPVAAARRLWQPLADRPEAGIQVAALVAAALCVPLVRRAAAGPPRMVAAGAWALALGAALVASAADRADAVGAVLPAAAVVLALGLAPWRALRRSDRARASATLRPPTV
jgi:hypothetical protein